MSSLIYNGTIISRIGIPVPQFADGHPAHSKYDPRKEAERLVQIISPAGFFVVSGVGGGYFIEALHRRFPSALIVAAEGSAADIHYLASNSAVVDAIVNKGCQAIGAMSYTEPAIVPLCDLAAAITARYIPVLHGTLGVLEWEAWAHSNADLMPQFREQVRLAKSLVAADASTQSRFGRIWQRNILLNAATFVQMTSCKSVASSSLHSISGLIASASCRADRRRMALVVAAGPSLDLAVERIRQVRGLLFIIATDTAYSVLTKCGIASDAVVSIDGQEVSHAHFMMSPLGSPLFVMDMCADPATVRMLWQSDSRLLFVRTGHPLSARLATHIPLLDAGGGTVTIAACDWARQAGFERIAVCGADFAYIGGRPYSRGTYLDAQYAMSATRLFPTEAAFIKLMLRTALVPLSAGRVTTPVLSSYRSSFEAWMTAHGYTKIDDDESEGGNAWVEYKAHRPSVPSPCNDSLVNNGGDIRKDALAAWLQEGKEALRLIEADANVAASASFTALAKDMQASLMGALPCASFFRAHKPCLDTVGALQSALREAEKYIR